MSEEVYRVVFQRMKDGHTKGVEVWLYRPVDIKSLGREKVAWTLEKNFFNFVERYYEDDVTRSPVEAEGIAGLGEAIRRL